MTGHTIDKNNDVQYIRNKEIIFGNGTKIQWISAGASFYRLQMDDYCVSYIILYKTYMFGFVKQFTIQGVKLVLIFAT